MKVLALALLACSLTSASPSFAGETVVVTGPRIPPGPTPPNLGGGGSGNDHVQKPIGFGKDGNDLEGGGTPMPKKVGNLNKGDPVKDDLGAELGKIFAFLARDFNAAGEIWVKIETPSGYKIEVRITAQAKVTGRR